MFQEDSSDSRSIRRRLDRVDRLLLTTASALLLTLSQSPIGQGYLAPFALIPWLLATRRARFVEAIALGSFLGLAHGLSAAGWIASAFESQGSHGAQSFFAAFITVFWAKGLLYGVMGALIHRFREAPIPLQVFVPAIVFGCGEVWISTSRWGLPLLLLGYSQESVPGVAQLATIAGTPLLSAFLFSINSALALLEASPSRTFRSAVALLGAWMATAAFGSVVSEALRPSIDAGSDERTAILIQPNLRRSTRWDPAFQNVILDEVVGQTQAALESTEPKPDVILWPENLLTSPVDPDDKLGREIRSSVDGWDVALVSGVVRAAESESGGLCG
jgi:apolipoprotein N-acyltransferase